MSSKQPVTLRLDPRLVAAARQCAIADNRTLTNFVENVLKRHIDVVCPEEGISAAAGEQSGAQASKRSAHKSPRRSLLEGGNE